MTEPDFAALAERVVPAPIDTRRATPELYAALARAQEQAVTVRKRGYNEHASYNYSTAEDMIAAARDARRGTGLALLTTWRYERTPEDVTGWATIVLSWILTHSGGGQISGEVSIPAQSSKRNGADKCLAAGLTYLEGFLERSLMRLDRGEVHASEDRDAQDDTRELPERKPPDHSGAIATAKRFIAARSVAGTLTDDVLVKAITRCAELGVDEATVRSWVPATPSVQPSGGPPVFADLAPLIALQGADTIEALLRAATEHAAALRALDTAIVDTAIYDACTRIGGVDALTIGAAIDAAAVSVEP